MNTTNSTLEYFMNGYFIGISRRNKNEIHFVCVRIFVPQQYYAIDKPKQALHLSHKKKIVTRFREHIFKLILHFSTFSPTPCGFGILSIEVRTILSSRRVKLSVKNIAIVLILLVDFSYRFASHIYPQQ